jgi:predicted nucleic acid-binding protein
MPVRDVVIDADVMRSAGETEHPVSSSSRRALESVRERGHRVVLCQPIRDEYKKHSSRFSATWRASMVARKQVVNWVHTADEGLRDRLSNAFPSDHTANRDAVLKDAHLLEAANAMGQRIVSRDARANHLFRSVCSVLQQYGTLLWADLGNDGEKTQQWLEEDLPEAREFRLCPLQNRRRFRRG